MVAVTCDKYGADAFEAVRKSLAVTPVLTTYVVVVSTPLRTTTAH